VDGGGHDHQRVGLASDQQGRARLGDGMSPKVLWEVVRAAAARAGIDALGATRAPTNLRRLCHVAGGELDQIQFLLGRVSIQTTER
jgi:hypothetical protein